MGFRLQAFDPADAPDPEVVYANYLNTCAIVRRDASVARADNTPSATVARLVLGNVDPSHVGPSRHAKWNQAHGPIWRNTLT